MQFWQNFDENYISKPKTSRICNLITIIMQMNNNFHGL